MASYSLNGTELLKTTRDENNLQWGSTVWTSPQSAWNWPPEKTFDVEAFNITKQTNDALTLLSAVDPTTGLQMEKSFAFVKQPKGMHLQANYRLTNHGTDSVSRGIWENTRLPYSGEFYFEADSTRLDKLSGNFAKRGKSTVIEMREGDDEKGKVFAFPVKGRVTYTANGLRFRKLWFPAEGDVAPGQSPLEIYLSPEEGFVEFEVQGVYRRLAPGASVTLNVAWKVDKLEEKE